MNSPDSITEANMENLKRLLSEMQHLYDNWPQRDPVLLQQCEEEARRGMELPQRQETGPEFLQQLMEHENKPHPPFTSFRPRGTPIRLSYRDVGRRDYDKADPEYRKRVERAEKAVIDLAKQVDHAVYLLRDLLLKWPRVRGTLLTADWRALRDKTPSNLVFAIKEYHSRGELAAALDDLDLYLKERQNHKPDSEPNGPGPAGEMTRREETGSATTTINIQNSTVIMADGNTTINIDQHIEYITNLHNTVAMQPENSPTFAKVAKKTALDIIESTLKDVAKGQVREAAKQIYELGKDLGPVIVNTAAYGFFRNWLGL